MAMESLEMSAKTVDEATQLALQKLGRKREEVEVEVLNKGRSGILGLGAEDARIRVTPLPTTPTTGGPLAQEALEKILAGLGVAARVERLEGEEGTVLNVVGDDLGILIGRRGETLRALQYVVNLIVSRNLKTQAGVMVDVEGYKSRRYQALKTLAVKMAEQAKTSGRTMTLEPMPAAERRIVHLTLKDFDGVTTQSISEGESRKVAIIPKKGLSAPR